MSIGIEKQHSSSRRRHGSSRSEDSSRDSERSFPPLVIAAQIFLAVPVLVVPWFFGGVNASTQFWLAVSVILSLLCCLLLHFRHDSLTSVLPVAVVPLLLAVALGILQLCSLPPAMLATISPHSNEIWETFTPSPGYGTGDPSRAAFQLGVTQTRGPSSISVYPTSTRRDLALLIVAIGAFLAATFVFSCRKQPVVLFALASVIGIAIALFGIGQQLSWNGNLYGSIPLTKGATPFASFVNKNNCAGFLNLCLAGAVGLTVWSFSKTERRPGSVAAARIMSSPSLRDRPTLRWVAEQLAILAAFVGEFNVAKLFSITALVFITSGVICALSRGAWVAAVAAVAIVGGAMFAKRRRSGPSLRFLLPAVLLGFAFTGWVVAMVGWFGNTDLIFRGADSLRDPTVADGRVEHWLVGLRAALDFPLVGSGFGTYRFVYPLYESIASKTWFYHADNQYVEALEEGGLAGIVLMFAAIVFVALACLRLLREAPASTSYACGVAGLFAIVTQAIQAFTDFGLYLPANTILMAMICGMVTGRAAWLARSRGRHEGSWLTQMLEYVFPQGTGRVTTVACLVFVLCGCLWSASGINAASVIETAMKNSELSVALKEKEYDQLAQPIINLDLAVALQEGDAEAHRRLARLWLQRYRLRANEILEKQALPGQKRETLWQLTSPLELHGLTYRLESQKRTVDLENLRRSEPVQEDLANAVRHLYHARRSCPVLADVHVLLAEIERAVSDHSQDVFHLARASRLANANSALLAECGALHLQAGRVDEALANWKQSAELDGARLPALCLAASRDARLKSQVHALLPDSPQLLVKTAADLKEKGVDAEFYEALLTKATQLLSNAALSEAEDHYLRAKILATRNSKSEAIEEYFQATKLRPRETLWKYELAGLLAAVGRAQEAEDQITECLQADRNNGQYEALLKELIELRIRGDGKAASPSKEQGRRQ